MTGAARATGVHLGLLQAGYLLTLARVLSSAHATYAVVLTAWLAGSLLGLWLAVPARLAVVLGLCTYMIVQIGLWGVDFAALPVVYFVPAVVVSGVWSGRFFAVAVARDGRTGPIFAAETDGFLLGTVMATVVYVFVGRIGLVVAPLVTGAWLLLRRRGAAVAVVGLMVGGCDDPVAQVPAPDRQQFQAEVYPLLLRDCGFLACHGDPQRPLFVPGPGRTRLDPDTEVFAVPTAAELERSYDRARALLVEQGGAGPVLIHKTTQGAAHLGADPSGRNVYEDDAPELEVLRAWAATTEAGP